MTGEATSRARRQTRRKPASIKGKATISDKAAATAPARDPVGDRFEVMLLYFLDKIDEGERNGVSFDDVIREEVAKLRARAPSRSATIDGLKAMMDEAARTGIVR